MEVAKGYAAEGVKVDDEILLKEEFIEINTSLNPHQFDYSKYLELKQVYKQLYLKQDELIKAKVAIDEASVHVKTQGQPKTLMYVGKTIT